MTAELRRQRDGLVTASEVIDRRRRFTETVLAGVSSGVLSLDNEGHITIINRSAESLLGTGGACSASRSRRSRRRWRASSPTRCMAATARVLAR